MKAPWHYEYRREVRQFARWMWWKLLGVFAVLWSAFAWLLFPQEGQGFAICISAFFIAGLLAAFLWRQELLQMQ
ncbi:MAG: hypothetical protein KDA58_17265, partial [Planctomycetaceae bacterium]|nr:hypothetical protein [Planctomycetaceae bacterium]